MNKNLADLFKQCLSLLGFKPVSRRLIYELKARMDNSKYSSDLFLSSRDQKISKDFSSYVYVVVNFLFRVIFVFLLFLGMVIYANEVETKEK